MMIDVKEMPDGSLLVVTPPPPDFSQFSGGAEMTHVIGEAPPEREIRGRSRTRRTVFS